MTKEDKLIRRAERQEVPLLLDFIRGIARYEKMENEVIASREGQNGNVKMRYSFGMCVVFDAYLWRFFYFGIFFLWICLFLAKLFVCTTLFLYLCSRI